MADAQILSVGDLTDRLRRALSDRFPFIWVRGEVTNVSLPASGHIYFSLKDERAQLSCAWFTRRQRQGGFDPLTGEICENPLPARELVRNGAELICAGSIDIYAARGQYQLLVELAQPAGEGLLALEFEARKARLAKLGYFEAARKRPLPVNPQRVALITSRHGAAIHDFMEVAKDRGLSARIRLYNVPVQGEGAPPRIARAIMAANDDDFAEAIVLIRGGGSQEDLWAFNDEALAGVIFRSRLPVLAGIGHEIDTTLADLTADLRAATPSHAAQLLFTPRSELCQTLDNLALALARAQEARIAQADKMLATQANCLRLLSPHHRLRLAQDRLCQLVARIRREQCRRVEAATCNLARNYTILREARPMLRRLNENFARLERLRSALSAAAQQYLDARMARAALLEARLAASDPGAPLQKGYALLYGPDGLIRSVMDAPMQAPIDAVLADGKLRMQVKARSPKNSVSKIRKAQYDL